MLLSASVQIQPVDKGFPVHVSHPVDVLFRLGVLQAVIDVDYQHAEGQAAF